MTETNSKMQFSNETEHCLLCYCVYCAECPNSEKCLSKDVITLVLSGLVMVIIGKPPS